jgi:hypothetical protein
MSAVIEFPNANPRVQVKLTSYYCMTEEQEFAIYETRNALKGIVHLVDSIAPGNTLQINSEELSALLSLLEARLPDSNAMEFVPR